VPSSRIFTLEDETDRLSAIFKNSLPLTMRTTGCPETSIRNYHYSQFFSVSCVFARFLGSLVWLIISCTKYRNTEKCRGKYFDCLINNTGYCTTRTSVLFFVSIYMAVLGLYGRIMLKWIFKKWDGQARTR
jgi:hypothetical protein